MLQGPAAEDGEVRPGASGATPRGNPPDTAEHERENKSGTAENGMFAAS
ncbi:hypothetical protein [Butyricicoccus sp. Marseille-Q5471]|nr:hypothetical protein [Butyricicoccus sp. Marseille-Q5471]